MKRNFVLAGIFATTFVSNAARAQSNVNVNLALSDVLSFSVSQPEALTVNFDSEAKYSQGITALASDHITVVSSRGYTVKAIAGAISGSSGLNQSAIRISSSVGASNGGNLNGLTFFSGVALPATSSNPSLIVSATNTSWNGNTAANKFNITYEIGANGEFVGKETGSNVIPVTYLVAQP